MTITMEISCLLALQARLPLPLSLGRLCNLQESTFSLAQISGSDIRILFHILNYSYLN